MVSITAKPRTGVATADVRTLGQIPAVVYGRARTPVSVAVNYQDFEKLYRTAGESTLVDFFVDGNGEPVKVLIQDVQVDPVKRRIIHVDFLQVQMDVEMHAEVPLHFVGVSPAVKESGGTFNSSLTYVNVRCLPKDLVSAIEVDISSLKTFDDAIEVQHLVVPSGMTITDQPDTVVATIIAPLTEDQLKAMEESQVGDISKVEVAGEKKEEEGEAAEGEASEEKKEEKK